MMNGYRSARLLSRRGFATATETAPMQRTCLYDYHKSIGGKIVPFAGFEMPVQYKGGLMKEHNAVRENAGWFDVSHMGQVKFFGADREAFLERVTVIDFERLNPGQGSLSLLMNADGCIKDDTVITKQEDHVYMVINAGCKDKDLAHMRHILDTEFADKDVTMEYSEENALVAVQGPKAASYLEELVGTSLKSQLFMEQSTHKIGKLGVDALLTRCGYTGEDGFEVSLPQA